MPHAPMASGVTYQWPAPTLDSFEGPIVQLHPASSDIPCVICPKLSMFCTCHIPSFSLGDPLRKLTDVSAITYDTTRLLTPMTNGTSFHGHLLGAYLKLENKKMFRYTMVTEWNQNEIKEI
jgi:hypothetical protein